MIKEKHIFDDYYPFGLSFNSWQRGGSKKNDYLFNGIERQDELDIGWDLAFYRSYSPELGRWHQIDPKTSERESGYVGMGNNPILYSDFLGDTTQLPAHGQGARYNVETTYATTNEEGKAVAGVANVYINAKDGDGEATVVLGFGNTEADAKAQFKNGLEASANANAELLKFDAGVKYGSKDNNAEVKLETEVLSADAKAKANITKDGAAVALGAGAYAGKAEGKTSITIMGVKFEFTGKATGASAHIGGEAKMVFKDEKGQSGFGAKFDAGFILGGGIGFNISW